MGFPVKVTLLLCSDGLQGDPWAILNLSLDFDKSSKLHGDSEMNAINLKRRTIYGLPERKITYDTSNSRSFAWTSRDAEYDRKTHLLSSRPLNGTPGQR
jgi:hypothetical protein